MPASNSNYGFSGIGIFVCTYAFMYIWVVTGEVNAKRVRERYLEATLRQDVAYFDNVGAGEVATRIQTDTRKIPSCINEGAWHAKVTTARSGAARYFRKGGTHHPVSIIFRHRFHRGLCSSMEACLGNVCSSPLYGNRWRRNDHVHLQIQTV